MSVWDFTGPSAALMLSEIFHAGFYFCLFLLVLAALRHTVCEIIDKLYDRRFELQYPQMGDEEEPVSQQPPLHIV